MAGREVLERARLIPKWELKLQKEARLHNAHSSTSIEGNALTLDQVKDLAERKGVVATEKDKREVANYLQAIDAIPQYAEKKTLDAHPFLEIHKTITAGTLKNEKDCGSFRDRQVFVGRRVFEGTGFKEIVEYMPPPTSDVARLVEEFFEWLDSDTAETISSVLLAGIAHYEIARIHPFIDGNGRTARLLASLVLYRSGFDHRRFFALDDHYDENRPAYYAALKTAQQNDGDITQWLEYFTEGVLISVNRVKGVIEKFELTPKEMGAGQMELTQKQIKILEKIKGKGRVTNKDLRDIFAVSRQAILKEVSKLVDTDIIELVGKGRGAYYRMKG
jgi:Fic family protein